MSRDAVPRGFLPDLPLSISFYCCVMVPETGQKRIRCHHLLSSLLLLVSPGFFLLCCWFLFETELPSFLGAHSVARLPLTPALPAPSCHSPGHLTVSSCFRAWILSLCQLSRAAVRKYHRLGGLSNRDQLFHSCGGCAYPKSRHWQGWSLLRTKEGYIQKGIFPLACVWPSFCSHCVSSICIRQCPDFFSF